MSLKEQICKENLPKHIAIIMDGNGRWAQQRNQERVFGHRNGVEAVRDAVEASAEIGVKYLTLYAFSTENWKRPKEEVDALMELLVKTIHGEVSTLNKNSIKLNAIGDLTKLNKDVYNTLQEAIDNTKNNCRMTLTLALNYSSRWEITNAVKNIAQAVKNNQLQPDEIDENVFNTYLNTYPMPDPELLIRTSGECRISNYLLWQIAYAELYFTQKFWPDFRKEDLYEAILAYQSRERRFGDVGKQKK